MQSIRNTNDDIDYLLQDNRECSPFFLLGSAGSGKTHLLKKLMKKNIDDHEPFLYCGLLVEEMEEIIKLYPGNNFAILETDSVQEIIKALKENKGVFLKTLSPLSKVLIRFLIENTEERGFYFSDNNQDNIKKLFFYIDGSNEVLGDVMIFHELRKLGIMSFITCQFLEQVPEELLATNFLDSFSNFCIFSIREDDTNLLIQKGIISAREKNDILNQESGQFLFKNGNGSKKINLN